MPTDRYESQPPASRPFTLPARKVRGGRVHPSKPALIVGTDVWVGGRKEGAVVYLKTARSAQRAFFRACEENGVTVYDIGENIDAGAMMAAELVSTPAGILAVVEHFAVLDWHYIVGVRVPPTCSGAGTPTPRTERFVRSMGGYRPAAYRVGMGKDDRRAEDERDRRKSDATHRKAEALRERMELPH